MIPSLVAFLALHQLFDRHVAEDSTDIYRVQILPSAKSWRRTQPIFTQPIFTECKVSYRVQIFAALSVKVVYGKSSADMPLFTQWVHASHRIFSKQEVRTGTFARINICVTVCSERNRGQRAKRLREIRLAFLLDQT